MKTVGLCLVFGWLLVCGSSVEAHAFLDSAEPPVGSTVKESPVVIKLWFTRHLQTGSSMVQVFASDHREVDRQDVRIDASDPALLTVSVPHLGPDTYRVVWTATCIDGHKTHGDFIFQVTPS